MRTVDYTTATPTVTVTCDADPAKNDWNLGAGSDAPPAGLTNKGYGTEVRWSLNDLRAQGVLVPGHSYRFYVIVHDGDQNKSGGDCGQASFDYVYSGPLDQPAAISGHVTTANGPLEGVTITLSGTDVNGMPVFLTTVTDTAMFQTPVWNHRYGAILGPTLAIWPQRAYNVSVRAAWLQLGVQSQVERESSVFVI